jgi:hypothetical protein
MLAEQDGASLDERELKRLRAECDCTAIFQFVYPQLPGKLSTEAHGN